MDNFLAAVDPLQGVRIIIKGQPVWVERRRLLCHLQLSQIEIEIGKTRHPVEISGLIIKYVALAGLSDNQIKNASTYDLLEAFFALKRLNSWQWVLPWLRQTPDGAQGEQHKPEIYDYDGRRWAIWIHKLATRYGWGPDEIWRLYPEEAAAYIQEIMISEYHEREDRRALSEVSYKYDPASKTSRFTPAPMYSWMVDESPPEPVRVWRGVLPVGNVVKMDN